jgi:hypothetical protein
LLWLPGAPASSRQFPLDSRHGAINAQCINRLAASERDFDEFAAKNSSSLDSATRPCDEL